MSLRFAITINSSIQLLLCILPLAVVINFIRNDTPMNLLFAASQVISLFVSVMLLE